MAKSKKEVTKKEVAKKQESKDVEKVKEVTDNLKADSEEQALPTKKELSHAEKVANVVQNRTV